MIFEKVKIEPIDQRLTAERRANKPSARIKADKCVCELHWEVLGKLDIWAKYYCADKLGRCRYLVFIDAGI